MKITLNNIDDAPRPKYFYHATFASRVHSIQTHGISFVEFSFTI